MMNSSSQEGDRKQKITEVKTFPVPFALKAIKENISIRTNAASKPSKEEIIKEAFKFHSQGNISKAAKYYQYCINQGFNDHRVFSNYAGILQGMGKLDEAEISLRKAIQIKPSYAYAHINLGSILELNNKLEEAKNSYRKAQVLKPELDMNMSFATLYLKEKDPPNALILINKFLE